jgi:hypothetical protein
LFIDFNRFFRVVLLTVLISLFFVVGDVLSFSAAEAAFTLQDVIDQARKLSKKPYQDHQGQVPEFLLTTGVISGLRRIRPYGSKTTCRLPSSFFIPVFTTTAP